MELPNSLIASAVLRRGSILHAAIFEEIDHGKFFVVIGITPTSVVGFLFINTNNSKYVHRNRELLAKQYPMRHADYDFLRYDSVLGANEIQTINVKCLTDSIKDGTTKIIGRMKEEHMNELLEVCRNSKLFSKLQKQRFFYD